jgi:hypothetical protein
MTGIAGFNPPESFGSEYNAQAFIIQQLLAQMHTVTLVEVKAVTNSGSDSAVGFVDVLPLVNQIGGTGVAQLHGIISKCPYFRLQSGTNAIIIDPQVGDIGIAIFAERDISSVVANWAQANPGSGRRYDMSDCLYVGGGFNVTPTQYISFNGSGINIVSPVAVNVTAPDVNVNASGSAVVSSPSILLQNTGAALKTLLNSTLLTWLEAHVHSNGNGGGNTGIPTTTPASTTQTSVVQAE